MHTLKYYLEIVSQEKYAELGDNNTQISKNKYKEYLKNKQKYTYEDFKNAIEIGLDIDTIKKIMEKGNIDPSDNNNEAIKIAAENGHAEAVRLLLQDRRVDPSADNNYAIRYAARNGHAKVVRLLLQDKRVDPSDYDNYAMRYATKNGHTEVVKLLQQNERIKSNFITNQI